MKKEKQKLEKNPFVNKQFKTNKYTLVWVMGQFFITLILIVVGIIGLIKGGIMMNIAKIILGLDFLVMGYNNKWVYNRKKLTILYLIMGLLFIIMGIVAFF